MGKKILGVIATLLLVSAARAQDISAPRVLMHRSELPRGFAPAREIRRRLLSPFPMHPMAATFRFDAAD